MPPQISANDVVVRQGGKVRPVLSWEPAQSSARSLDLIILIDEALPNNVATRWDDFEKFLTSLPANAHVGVAYANRGSVQFAQQPTLNHAQAAKSFRNPADVDPQMSGIYQSVQTLAHAWPANKNGHVILLLSSGYGSEPSGGPSNWENMISMQNAINETQGKGIIVYSIFARASDRYKLNPAVISWGQSGLGHLSKVTGGKAFIFGEQTPPSFQPYLQELLQLLGQQYTLTFQAQLATKAGFVPLEIDLKTSSVQVHFPARVYVPGTK